MPNRNISIQRWTLGSRRDFGEDQLHCGRTACTHNVLGCTVVTLCCAGITEFIDTALDAGAAVGIVAGTCSIPEEQILTAALFALGEKRSAKLHTFVCSPQQQQQADGQQNSFEGLTLEQSMAAARARVSQSSPNMLHNTLLCAIWYAVLPGLCCVSAVYIKSLQLSLCTFDDSIPPGLDVCGCRLPAALHSSSSRIRLWLT